MDTITRDELRDLLAGDASARVVLTLGPRAHEAARIPGTETFATVEDALAGLDRDEEIVVYCSHDACHSSRRAASLLARSGYTRVRRYPGGLSDWYDAGLPLEGSSHLASVPAGQPA